MASKPPGSAKKTISVDAEHYKSLVLGRLRAEIEAKRAHLKNLTNADAADLYSPDDGSGYWKMHYWRSGHIHRVEDVRAGTDEAPKTPPRKPGE